nr:Cardiolipin synthase N-terminal [Ipomoea batatas]GMD19549.1 Cardiolipin synthase N-terminal [Ipomoea batatas]
MAGRANNLLASVFTPPPPKPKFAGISTRRVLFLHNRTCFSIATKATTIPRKIRFQIRRSSLTTPSSQDPVLEEDSSPERSEVEDEDGGGENGGADGEGWSWTLSLLLFGFWAGLMYYVLILAPNQTPSTDLYFLKKLLNLKGDDGFRMNDVLVAEWYIMGLWPLVYSMLLLPTARTPKCSVPVWPFLVLSCIGGAYALFPFFILWKPPPPPVEETELRRWPLNFLESKLTAGILLASGLGLIVYAGISTGVWKEFYQYFRQSRFIHAMSIDFVLLSAFAPFWVFNDMTTRKWYNKGSWLLPVSVVPFLGPALYLLLRPPVPAVQASSSLSSLEEE